MSCGRDAGDATIAFSAVLLFKTFHASLPLRLPGLSLPSKCQVLVFFFFLRYMNCNGSRAFVYQFWYKVIR